MLRRVIMIVMVTGLLLMAGLFLFMEKPKRSFQEEVFIPSSSEYLSQSKVSRLTKRGLDWDLIEEPDGTIKKTFHFGAVNYEHDGKFIPIEEYLSFYVEDDIMYLKTLNDDECTIEIEYELINPDLTAENVYNIVKRRGGYYFTTEVTEDVEKIKYKLNCNNFDISFQDDMLILGDFGIDFSMARELQNISANFKSQSNEIEFEIIEGMTGSLNLIDPTVEYNYNTSNAGIVSHALRGQSCDDPFPPENALPPNPGNDCDFFAFTYSSIEDSENVRQATNIFTGATTEFSHHIFNVTINDDINNIESIEWTHEGSVSSSDVEYRLYIWNFTSSSWLQFGDASTSTTDETVTYSTTSLGDFLSNNVTHMLFFGQNNAGIDTNQLRTDYVKLDVTYIPNLSATIIEPTTTNTVSVNSWENISVAFNVYDWDELVTLDQTTINNITIGGVQAEVVEIPFNGGTMYIRSGEVAGDGLDTVTFNSAMPDTSYSPLTTGLTDTDVMFAGTYKSKGTGSVTYDWEDDTGGAEAGDFMWLVLAHGEVNVSEGKTIYCDGNTNFASSGTFSVGSRFGDTNYSVICNALDNIDSPNCITTSKSSTSSGYRMEDDGGALENVDGVEWCAFEYGEYSSGNLSVKAGSDTQSSGVVTVTFSSNMPNTDYVVMMTNRESGAEDGCACEITGRTISGFTAVCEDDGDSVTNCNGESNEWVAISNLNEDLVLNESSFERWENATDQFVNVTVPDFETGTKDLILNVSFNSVSTTATQTNSVDYGGTDTCTCAGLNTDWEVDLSDNCIITSNCELGTGKLNFTGTGNFYCDANINTSDLGDVGNGNTFWVRDDCKVVIR